MGLDADDAIRASNWIGGDCEVANVCGNGCHDSPGWEYTADSHSKLIERLGVAIEVISGCCDVARLNEGHMAAEKARIISWTDRKLAALDCGKSFEGLEHPTSGHVRKVAVTGHP